MILADKIIELRKKSGMTQDELAEKLGVSRQSVSKWEGAQSTPDLARILKLAEIFSVSTDVLLKDELELEQNISTENIETVSVKPHVETEPPLRPVSMAEAVEYLEAKKKNAFLIALGIALSILSPTIPIIFENTNLEDLSAISIFLFMAAAVALFIYAGSIIKKFEYLEKECLDTEYGVEGMVREKRENSRPKNTLHIIIGIILCILSVIPAIITDELFESSAIEDLGSVSLFIFVAIGVFFIVRANVINGGFEVLLEEEEYNRARKAKMKKAVGESVAVMGIYWSIVTALYLGYSFITFNWHISWVIWVVAAVLSPAVVIIANAIKK